MRLLTLLLFSVRQVGRTFLIFHLTRFLPLGMRTRFRYRNASRTAAATAAFFQDRAGIFIKAAQFVRNISNLFEEDISDQFAMVHDSVVPDSPDRVERRLERELGKPLRKLFREFDLEALATASIGQVHSARLGDGRKVAVKLMHSGLEYQTRQDLRALRMTMRLVGRAFPHLDFSRHLQEFTHMVILEMDFKNEAENLRRFRNNFRDDPRVVFPAVLDDYSTHYVITTEFVEGIPLNNRKALVKAGVNLSELSELLMETYIRMIFEHRFFHADPHPGNLSVLPADGQNPLRIVFYDFGAAEHITPSMMRHIQMFLFIMRDRSISYLVDLAMEAGFLDKSADRERFQELFEIIYARYGAFQTDSYKQIDPLRLGRVFTFRDIALTGMRFRDLVRLFHVPRRYLYLARTLTYLLTVARTIDPEVNIFRVASPFVDKHLIPNRRRFREMLRRRNWQGTFERLMAGYYRMQIRPPGNGQSVSSPQQAPSGPSLVPLSLLSLGFTGLCWLLFQEGYEQEARFTAILPGLGFLVVAWKTLRQ
jgi:predicted unusual protein kinase regulating ubiquinone biosynthesis (AarF/ABC1/UbiB family)